MMMVMADNYNHVDTKDEHNDDDDDDDDVFSVCYRSMVLLLI